MTGKDCVCAWCLQPLTSRPLELDNDRGLRNVMAPADAANFCCLVCLRAHNAGGFKPHHLLSETMTVAASGQVLYPPYGTTVPIDAAIANAAIAA